MRLYSASRRQHTSSTPPSASPNRPSLPSPANQRPYRLKDNVTHLTPPPGPAHSRSQPMVRCHPEHQSRPLSVPHLPITSTSLPILFLPGSFLIPISDPDDTLFQGVVANRTTCTSSTFLADPKLPALPGREYHVTLHSIIRETRILLVDTPHVHVHTREKHLKYGKKNIIHPKHITTSLCHFS